MTEFGTLHVRTWYRVHTALYALAVVITAVLAYSNPDLFLLPPEIVLVVVGLVSLFANTLAGRIGTARTTQTLLLLDSLVTATAVMYFGGPDGSFIAIYTVVILTALVLLERRRALRVMALCVALFLLQFGLTRFSLRAVPVSLPLYAGFPGQELLVVVYGMIAVSLVRVGTTLNRQLRLDETTALAERARAEQVQQRWTLINNVTLRVQEAQTPKQVYALIGEEIERLDLHGVILEWTEPDVAMRLAYASLSPELLERFRELKPANALFPLADQPVLARVIHTRIPALLQDLTQVLQTIFPGFSQEKLVELTAPLNLVCIVLAPMIVRGHVAGVMGVFGQSITENDLAPLAALAQQAASALDKARLLTEQGKRAAQLELVTDIATQLSSAENADQIIQPLVRAIGERFGYDVVSIVLIDSARQELYLAASYTTLSEMNSPTKRQPITRGILGLVARTGTAYVTNDVRADPYYYSFQPERDPIRAELAVPLRGQNSNIGVMDLESTKPDAFDASDVNAITLLADQISAALVKTRALAVEQKRAGQLALVSEVSARALAFSEPDAMVRTMVQLVQERFGYHHVCVSMYDSTRNELEQHYAAGPNAALFPFGRRWRADEGLIGLAARTRQTVYSGDLRQDPRYAPDPDTIANSALCVPLVSGKNVLGVLDVESEALHAFDANDFGAMESLANQMAAAIEKARLLQLERRRAAQMALVNRIASRTARLMPAEQLMREAVEMIRTQFGYYNVSVFVRDQEQPGVRLVANVGGLTPLLQTPLYLTGGIIGYVDASGNTYLCPKPQEDIRYASPFQNRADDPVHSELTIPLRRGETVIGVLDIQSEQANIFTPSDIAALEALTDQLAAALENARLFESEKERAAQLDAVRVLSLKLTAERDLDVLLDSAVASAAELVQADASALYIVDEARGDLVIRISNNLPHNYVGHRLKIGEGSAGQVVEHGTPILIEDYSTWTGRSQAYELEGFTRMMSVPLKWQERVLGVINLHRTRAHPMFNAEELRFANLFAAQAAVAMENARLVAALQTRLHAQQTLSDTSAGMLATTDAQTILDRAAAAATRALQVETALVFLPSDGDELVTLAYAGNTPPDLQKMHLPPDSKSTPTITYTTKHPMLWSDSNPHSQPFVYPLPQPMNFRAGLAVPMLVGERAVGVIAVHTSSERHFDATDVQTLALLANQTASALERARYFDQVQGRVRELDLLFEGYRATSSTLDPRQVIARLLEQLVRALDLTSAFFVRIDEANATLTQTDEYFSEHANAHEREVKTRVWSMDAMPDMQSLLSNQVLIAQRDDPQLSPVMRRYMEASAAHTVLRVPVMSADRVIGYVGLWETRAPRPWTYDQVRFVQTMTSQAAAALVNAELYQAAQMRTRELQALHEASRVINSTLDVNAICENSVDSLRDILGYKHVSIYFLENQELYMQVQRGYNAPLFVLPRGEGVIARAVSLRETVFLSNVSREPNYVAALLDVKSEIAVPLLMGERVLGALNVETVQGEVLASGKSELTQDDAQMLTTFANQLVSAIENARLLQQTQEHLAQVRTLHAASQSVNADLDLETVLKRMATQFVSALNVDFCTVLELDSPRNEMVVLFDLDPEPRAQVLIGDRFSLAKNPHLPPAMVTGRAQVYRIDDPALHPLVRVDLETYLCQTIVVLPMLNKGQVIGVIELGDRKASREFRPDELDLATSLASQATVSLANARLYRASQQRLQETETLYRFARDLGGTLDISSLGKRALDAAARLTDFDVGEVSLVRATDGAIVPLVMTGAPDLMAEAHIVPRGVGIMGWVVEHGRTVRVGDVTRDPRYQPGSAHIMSEICLPLRIGDRISGVLNLEAKAPNAFDAHSEELLIVFANQLAIAIENARLYEQIKRDAEVKAALLRELSHRVKNNLAAITSLLYMALDEPHDTREQILSETLGRVQSMALAHALLARSAEARVNLIDLGRQVLNDTVRNLSRRGAPILVEVRGDSVNVGARQTTTLALVLNELATNSLRHAFGGIDAPDTPILRFTVDASDPEIECHMEDNGMGLPEEFVVDTGAGLGLNLVRTLVEKDLHGLFRLERRAPWTRAEIRFRLQEDPV